MNYEQLLLDFDNKTGSYVAIDENNNILFKSDNPKEVFDWASKNANVIKLGRKFKTPVRKRRQF